MCIKITWPVRSSWMKDWCGTNRKIKLFKQENVKLAILALNSVAFIFQQFGYPVKLTLVIIKIILQVRKYSPFIVVETNGDKLSGSSGFNDVTGWVSIIIHFSYIIYPFFITIPVWISLQVYFWKEFHDGENTNDYSCVHSSKWRWIVQSIHPSSSSSGERFKQASLISSSGL